MAERLSKPGRPPIGKIAMSATERHRRWLAKQRAMGGVPMAPPQNETGRAQQMERDLAAAAAEIAALQKAGAIAAAEIAALKTERDARLAARFAPKLRQAPKGERPPLPPDEVRDRRIKSLETANRNMRAELRHLREWRRTSGVPDRGGMTLATYRKIAMALHPDRQPAEAERADACKAFTAWSSSLKEAAAKERQ